MTVPIPVFAAALLLALIVGAAILAVAAERHQAARVRRIRAARDTAQLELEPTTSPTGRIVRALEPVRPLGTDSGEWPQLGTDGWGWRS